STSGDWILRMTSPSRSVRHSMLGGRPSRLPGSVARATHFGRWRAACANNSSRRVPAISPMISNRSGRWATTSSVFVSIDPVDPSTTRRRRCPVLWLELVDESVTQTFEKDGILLRHSTVPCRGSHNGGAGASKNRARNSLGFRRESAELAGEQEVLTEQI